MPIIIAQLDEKRLRLMRSFELIPFNEVPLFYPNYLAIGIIPGQCGLSRQP